MTKRKPETWETAYEADITAAADILAGLTQLTPDEAKSMLNVAALVDKEIAHAWAQRRSNPKAWQRAIKKVAANWQAMLHAHKNRPPSEEFKRLLKEWNDATS